MGTVDEQCGMLGEAELPGEGRLASGQSAVCSVAEGLLRAGLQCAVICLVGLHPSSQPR